jgi:hypothetical protein
MAAVAMIVALGWAGVATAGAQTRMDTDFGGGTHDGTEVFEPDDLGLSPGVDIIEAFDETALPADWEMSPWGAGGSATVAGGVLTVDGARANPVEFYGSDRSLDFAATFTADPFQHVGFGEAFADPPWAMFSTGGGALAVGLYARTAAPGGGPAENTPIAGVDPLVEHDYSIEWTPTEVLYYVDGDLVVTHPIAIAVQLRPIASDFNVGGGSVEVEYLDLYPYPYVFPSEGTFTSRVFDAGNSRATWRTLTPALDTPAGTDVTFEARTGSTPTPDASWTEFQPVIPPGGDVTGPAERRYLQYRATLFTTDTSLTPFVESVTLGYEVATDTPPNQTPGGGGQGGGGQGGGQTSTPPTVTVDEAPPNVRVIGKAVRVSRKGVFRLRTRCPEDEQSCRVTLRVKRDGRVLARKTVTIEGGETRTFRLRLSASTLRKLIRSDRLKVSVRIAARDASGNLSVTSKRITLREPR